MTINKLTVSLPDWFAADTILFRNKSLFLIHIQSEQKRRAQIKDGFEDLRTELPACLNKKMSKVTLLHRTVQHIQHLKSTQMTILAELERLVQENEQLRTFQQGVLQKQALENMYSIGNI
ncbi:hypothetical protein MFLAVUS_011506 [Mucor flavus]|uniref:BHLH domain-containing protein n=1 Tax=Mucor flavus TaxID=439312 RepID=A0ABP9ZFM4_9FUNG